ncbi:hypothetical protein SERLA73DRAFT_186900 [Serpula lacrymans var. lacrymans S7.3]|uniref:CENP-C homolog n=2 Tax=Serpula lacrymans var. lacrymans TaxID=341189 RepID=F8Q828_SERL3|nr:uncharacterized protein SERLADRAFT_476177 [Serpula lacrymans var. lacrymans S7.9]EGN95716.1 hypothetical protein SERLA73DRAFT_186900 [Serpula lacrymans var. lacrymans S7.3]EGO21239.1 hypothetical protein SERLADRAFT_476177 [Serpula lacrymans var. lacrymans S7.9]
MPREPERRKSSIGSRRGPPKRHIPFRGDDLGLGKKTGITVDYVDPDSDEFEPFVEIMKQADKRPQPQVKTKKKKVSLAPPLELDEDGEMSMDLAESNQGSPLAYFTNAHRSIAPNSINRIGSSSRAIPRVSDVDYDQVPSPRPRSSLYSRRSSLANGAGPSNLSTSHTALDPELGFEDADGGFDDYEPPENNASPEVSPRRTSFTQIDQDGEDEEEAAAIEEDIISRPQSSRKGKGRADPTVNDDIEQGSDENVEDEIARGLEDVDNGEADAEEDPENDPPAKKTRTEEEQTKKSKGRPKKADKVMQSAERSPDPQEVRRGKRHRYQPLEYWRQERVKYGRRDSGVTLVPQIKEIIRVPKEPIVTLGKVSKKRKRPSNPKNPEEGWDDNTETMGIVKDYVTGEEVERRVAWTSKMVQPKQAANSDWLFQKIFGDGDFIAAGQLVIPPKGRKPSKGSKDNTYVFYVVEGAISLQIHETDLVLATGGMFLVPRGNTYFIENICDRNAKLFFTQARKVPMSDEEFSDRMAQSVPPSVRPRFSDSAGPSVDPRGGKSSSAAVPPVKKEKKGTGNKRAASTKV